MAAVARPRSALATRVTALASSQLVTAATLVVALVLRGRRALLLVDFPLNDGGMFYTAIQDIRAAGFALPAVLTYNGGIPFAYPPLAFYLVAGLSDATGVSTIDLLRVLPPILSTLSVAAFIPIARRLSASGSAAAIAVFVYAVQPSAYTWMVMGGGLTRALGLVFALVALAALLSFYERPRRLTFAIAAVGGALALLSHIEMAWFLAFSAALFVVARRPSRRVIVGAGASGACAIALAAPWWLTVLLRHGVGPFVAAATTGSLDNPVLDLLAFQRTDEPYFPLIAAAAIAGVVFHVARGRYLIPAWLVAIALLDHRSFNALSGLPIGILAGSVVTELIAPLFTRRHLAVAAAVAGIVYVTFSSAKADQTLHRALKPDERSAMAWVANGTPADARFLVITQSFWAGDRVAEWFPALTERVSVTTVQGSEWLPRATGFWPHMWSYESAQDCADSDGDCLARFMSGSGITFDYVYLPKTAVATAMDESDIWCCGGLRAALRHDDRYALVYDGPGATIFKRR
ncbi:MAG TPA: hypothetical protein VI814_14310 [Candidatus Limnocylindria bacterium]